MKTVNYGDGVVEFRVPASWKEEHTDDGSTFYEDKRDSGTFRLHLITATAPAGSMPTSAADVLKTIGQAHGRAELLPNGNALARSEKSTVDRGYEIKIFYWFVANLVSPQNARIATFSYTILAKLERNPHVLAEVQMLDREIRVAEFATETGA